MVAAMALAADLMFWGGDATDGAAWRANAADGSSAKLSVEPGVHGTALRFDFTLTGHGAWAITRRDLVATLPPHYVAVVDLRGAGTQPLELQLKLVDASGANVWWWRRHGFVPGNAP